MISSFGKSTPASARNLLQDLCAVKACGHKDKILSGTEFKKISTYLYVDNNFLSDRAELIGLPNHTYTNWWTRSETSETVSVGLLLAHDGIRCHWGYDKSTFSGTECSGGAMRVMCIE